MTTCQICGRTQKTPQGRIAHHGYRQPWLGQGNGSRTVSCPGSRHLPYEISRDAIPVVRDNYRVQRTSLAAWIAEFIETPPEQIVATRHDAWGTVRQQITLDRPVGFNAEENFSQGAYKLMTYELEHASRLRTMRRNLAMLTESIKFLEERYAAWVPG